MIFVRERICRFSSEPIKKCNQDLEQKCVSFPRSITFLLHQATVGQTTSLLLIFSPGVRCCWLKRFSTSYCLMLCDISFWLKHLLFLNFPLRTFWPIWWCLRLIAVGSTMCWSSGRTHWPPKPLRNTSSWLDRSICKMPLVWQCWLLIFCSSEIRSISAQWFHRHSV